MSGLTKFWSPHLRGKFYYPRDAGTCHKGKWVFSRDRTAYAFDPRGCYMSEKFDGVRAKWSNGKFQTRSGRVIHAPQSFLMQLPKEALDGELLLGYRSFPRISGLVRRADPDPEDWAQVIYLIFDLPDRQHLNFGDRYRLLQKVTKKCRQTFVVPQRRVVDMEHAHEFYRHVLRAGGEGIVIRDTQRAAKWKPVLDAEATVLGFNMRNGQLSSFHVALVDDPDKHFNLSGKIPQKWRDHPRSKGCPQIGDVVNFSFMEFTANGIPRMPIFERLRPEE